MKLSHLSGWVRLFLVVWAAMLVFFGYRLHQYRDAVEFAALVVHQKFDDMKRFPEGLPPEDVKLFDGLQASADKNEETYEDADFQFYVFGLAAPPLVALAVWWIARGFRRRAVLASAKDPAGQGAPKQQP